MIDISLRLRLSISITTSDELSIILDLLTLVDREPVAKPLWRCSEFPRQSSTPRIHVCLLSR